ncbi:Hypothetical protein PMT_2447 [Prochlorococcus marinus str. MIT 9313]|uniref:Uncharacterized protein n=1 Tax=Prochlorococcus marinus (strain MIT 9313) TaxID=74547 RepID=B9ERR6_PROMM|nr:Hypothetical protein PMT_2447 [Prochlorococcus marinus str. MIT 9313]
MIEPVVDRFFPFRLRPPLQVGALMNSNTVEQLRPFLGFSANKDRVETNAKSW